MRRRTIEEEIEDELNSAVEEMLTSAGNHEAVLELQQEQKAIKEEREAKAAKEQAMKAAGEPITPVDEPVKKKSKGFKIFLLIYSLLLIGVIAFGLKYVWDLLIDYEAGMPDVKMTQIMETLDENELLRQMDEYPFVISEFDTVDSVQDIYAEIMKDKQLTFKRDSKFRNETPVYQILADDVLVATLSLNQNGVNKHKFAVWEQGTITFNEDLIEYQSIAVKVPAHTEVVVNGTVLSETYLVDQEMVPKTEHIDEFVAEIPYYDIYRLEQLIKIPEIAVNNSNVNIVPVEQEEYYLAYEYDQSQEAYDEISGLAMDIAHSYATYLINKGNLSVAHSRSIGTARQYFGSMDTAIYYLWNEEYTYEFSDESVSNVVRYSDDCISCDASYVLTVRYRLNRSISYHTCIHGMYVKQDGVWYLADFELEDTEEQD